MKYILILSVFFSASVCGQISPLVHIGTKEGKWKGTAKYLDTLYKSEPLFTKEDSIKLAEWTHGDLVISGDTIYYRPKVDRDSLRREIYKFFWKQIDSLENELDKLPKRYPKKDKT